MTLLYLQVWNQYSDVPYKLLLVKQHQKKKRQLNNILLMKSLNLHIKLKCENI